MLRWAVVTSLVLVIAVVPGALGDVKWPKRVRNNPPNWTPKTNASSYNPATKEWANVISACRAVIRYEKRIGNFFIRSAFHDSMAVDVTACLAGNAVSPSCGGADSSLFLSTDEMVRSENANDNFSGIASRAAIKIASYYDISVADTLAVCSSVGIEMLSGNRLRIIGGPPGQLAKNFKVGRLDSLTPSTPGQLPAATATATEFMAFWNKHNFTAEEGVALLGSHSLIDEQGCLQGLNGSHTDYCDPYSAACTDLRMFRWQNHYYKDLCTPAISIHPLPPMEFQDPAIVDMADAEFEAAVLTDTCKFTSPVFRAYAQQNLLEIRAGRRKEIVINETVSIVWSNNGCEAGAAWGANVCPHSSRWMYTVNDAWLAQACQGTAANPAAVQPVQDAMRKFLNQDAWDSVVPATMIKMLNKYAAFVPTAIMIGGRECKRVHTVDRTCVRLRDPTLNPALLKCSGCAVGDTDCDPCCVCPGGFTRDGYAVQVGSLVPQLPPSAVITPAPPSATVRNAINVFPVADTDVPKNVRFPKAMDDVPTTPYGVPIGACAGDGREVRGFPSSPFRFTPFTQTFTNPPEAIKTQDKYCPTPARPGGHCIDVFNIDVYEIEKDLGLGCTAAKTKLLSYNGSVPGPTIVVPAGRQSLVRFNNKIVSDRYPPHPPCTTEAGRHGRPISIHLHGSASLAPYDGWAEDSTCSGETKDYIYPNNRPTTGWYHDHQVDITAENAHAGMAALYLIKTNNALGNGPDRWGLEGMEEVNMILQDRVLDNNCQLRLEPEGVHRNGHFGDINLVSGIPWPVLSAEPKWYRFRFLSAAVSRPWLVSLVNAYGLDVSSVACWMIAGDGGYRRTPVPFPRGGLFMGVAERYEVACDLSYFDNQTLFWWNTWDENRMKDVPFFCNSHLLMKVVVAPGPPACGTTCPQFWAPNYVTRSHIDALISNDDYAAAVDAAKKGKCDRWFIFGRKNGQWVINGDTWETFRVAARDVGTNAAEIWCLETRGGWFHPIHIHLIDMYLLHRFNTGSHPSLEMFEKEVPKDVVALHPGARLAILARFGPHRGEYMFHCHNLRHEDNEMMRSFKTSTYNATSAGKLAALSQLEYTQTIGKVLYDQYWNPRFPDASAKESAGVWAARPLTSTYFDKILDDELYRIFYPGVNERAQLCDKTLNPWMVNGC